VKVWKKNEDGSLNYFVSSVLSKGSGPDAYSPVWISMSLAFIISVTSNINAWINTSSEDVDFSSDINSLINALWVVYSFSFGIPAVSYVALSCLSGTSNVSVTFMQLFSLYGYSLAPFLPAALISVVPSAAVQWTCLV